MTLRSKSILRSAIFTSLLTLCFSVGCDIPDELDAGDDAADADDDDDNSADVDDDNSADVDNDADADADADADEDVADDDVADDDVADDDAVDDDDADEEANAETNESEVSSAAVPRPDEIRTPHSAEADPTEIKCIKMPSGKIVPNNIGIMPDGSTSKPQRPCDP